MTHASITITIHDVQGLRPHWSDQECNAFLEKYESTIYSSLSQYGREVLENLVALEDIERGAKK